MSLQALIIAYGYWVLVIGTFLEGETILILAGFLAHRGYLWLPWVIVAAFVGSLAGDQLIFFIGRFKGREYLQRKPAWQSKTKRAFELLEKHQDFLMIAFRFVYGMRTVFPFTVGMSSVKTLRFMVFNIIGAAAWAICIGSLGYIFGAAFEAVLGNIKHIEMEIALGIFVTGMAIFIVKKLRQKTTQKQ